jgi:superfamily II DNA helicase RecQ
VKFKHDMKDFLQEKCANKSVFQNGTQHSYISNDCATGCRCPRVVESTTRGQIQPVAQSFEMFSCVCLELAEQEYNRHHLSGTSNKLKNLLNLHRNGLLLRFVIDEAHCVVTWGLDFRQFINNSN